MRLELKASFVAAAAVAVYVACGGSVETTGGQDGGGGGSGPDVGTSPNDGGTPYDSGPGGESGRPPPPPPPGDADLGDGGPPSDGHAEVDSPWDANIADGLVEEASFDAPPAATGLAGFAFVVNDGVLTPMACPDSAWQYAMPSGETTSPPDHPPTSGVKNAYIVNTGTLPLAYVAASLWSPGQEPGVLDGETYQIAGVLAPGTQVDITPVYVGGYTAIVGSSEPFMSLDSGHPVSDEGSILWPPGVAGSGGASLMYVAQIYVPFMPPSRCMAESKMW
jgi:hypothetical protein